MRVSATEVDWHLESLGVEFPERRPADGDGRALRPILGNPLMLSLFLERIEAAPPPAADTEDPRGQLLTRYAQKLLDRASPSLPYPPARFAAWLRSLARGMLDDQQAVFQIERLQPRWLQARGSRLGYLMLSRCLASVAVAAPFVGAHGGHPCGRLFGVDSPSGGHGLRPVAGGLGPLPVHGTAPAQSSGGPPPAQRSGGDGHCCVDSRGGASRGRQPHRSWACARRRYLRMAPRLETSGSGRSGGRHSAGRGLGLVLEGGVAWLELRVYFGPGLGISMCSVVFRFGEFGWYLAGANTVFRLVRSTDRRFAGNPAHGPVRANFGTWISARSALIGAGWAAAATTVPVVVIYGPNLFCSGLHRPSLNPPRYYPPSVLRSAGTFSRRSL